MDFDDELFDVFTAEELDDIRRRAEAEGSRDFAADLDALVARRRAAQGEA